MDQIKNLQWKQGRWFLFGCVPLFFFLRGIHLILTGGGWISTTNQFFHWILLFLEVSISAFAVGGCFYLLYTKAYDSEKKFPRRMILIKAVAIAIIFTFIIHFIRIGFWLQNSIL
jgi:hypothetical protein